MLKSFLRGKIKAKRGEKRAVPTRGLLAVDGVDLEEDDGAGVWRRASLRG